MESDTLAECSNCGGESDRLIAYTDTSDHRVPPQTRMLCPYCYSGIDGTQANTPENQGIARMLNILERRMRGNGE